MLHLAAVVAGAPPDRGGRCRSRATGLVAAFVVLVGALLPATAVRAEAQERVVVGTVTDARTLQPLAGAQVQVVGTNVGALSDARGRFRLEGLAGDQVTLRVVMLGRRPLDLPVRVGDTNVRVVLEEQAVALDELVVTGTAGGTQRRALGNSVAKIDAAEAVRLAAPPTTAALINARAPGVVMTAGTGMIGAGPRIRIRGAASYSLNDQPLIYVDGVRVNNQVASGLAVQGFGSGVVSRLNDINPDDIESIEIIKGPAAATLYGTEASNGVIQIITKRGAISERPRFTLNVRQGANWFSNPEGRVPVTYWRNPQTGEILSQNIVAQENARGTPIFKTGHLQGYHLDVSGGGQALRYYVGVDYDYNQGIEPTNSQKKFSGRTNLLVNAGESLDIATSLGLTSSLTNLVNEAGAGGIWFSTFFNTPELRNTPRRGFLFIPPEAVWAVQQPKQNVTRFTGSVQLNHRPFSWFSHRLTAGIDWTMEQDENLVERITDPEIAQFYSVAAQAGSKFIRTRAINYGTFDWSGSVDVGLTENLRSQTSVGAQFYRNFVHAVAAQGTNFPAPGLKVVDALAQTFGGDAYQENVTVGTFIQQQFGWRDRLFLTAAVRADDNSAFGENFNLVYYPKVSGSWVINEEPFWRWDFVDALKLRAAYGQSGQQPETFAALQSFQPVTAGNGGAAITPQFIGNPDLAPERGAEVELGFEAGLLDDRLGIDFTWYDQRTRDAILLRDVAPSLGFPGSQFVNLGAISNTGFEVALRGTPVRRRNLDWDVTFSFSNNESEVRDLGGEEFIVIGSQRHHLGFPVAGWFREVVVSAELDANGRAINVMCDGGRPAREGGPPALTGGSPVPCAQAPRLYLGRASPKYEGAVSTTLTLFDRVRLYGLVDYKTGHKAFDNNTRARCQVFLNCIETADPFNHDPKIVAQMQSPGTLVDFIINDASYARLREISGTYSIPERFLSRFGADRASLTLAARNVALWTKWTGLDPEGFFTTQLHTRLEQDNAPQLMSFVATLNVSF
jgi:TonB-linked SusC/RagA family outer membrane protein